MADPRAAALDTQVRAFIARVQVDLADDSAFDEHGEKRTLIECDGGRLTRELRALLAPESPAPWSPAPPAASEVRTLRQRTGQAPIYLHRLAGVVRSYPLGCDDEGVISLSFHGEGTTYTLPPGGEWRLAWPVAEVEAPASTIDPRLVEAARTDAYLDVAVKLHRSGAPLADALTETILAIAKDRTRLLETVVRAEVLRPPALVVVEAPASGGEVAHPQHIVDAVLDVFLRRCSEVREAWTKTVLGFDKRAVIGEAVQAVAALRSPAPDGGLVDKCPACHGKGEVDAGCRYCGDSTYDHECETRMTPCLVCKWVRDALAAASGSGKGAT